MLVKYVFIAPNRVAEHLYNVSVLILILTIEGVILMTSNPLLARQVQINEDDLALLKKQRVEDVKDLVDKIDKLGNSRTT